MMPAPEVPLVRLENIEKRFGGVHALRGATLEIARNEVIGLVGDNGAGKSTLIKVLMGVHQPDSGTVIIDGAPRRISHPQELRALGIEAIYQDLALVGTFDLGANFFLGRELTRSYLGGLVTVLDKRRMREIALQVLRERVGITITNPFNPALVMSGGQRQAVAIGRSLYAKARLIVMDEPTAALGVEEQDKVLEIIRTIRRQGASVLIISHNLEHVFSVADRIAVMQGGRVAAVKKTTEATRAGIVGLIMGTAGDDA